MTTPSNRGPPPRSAPLVPSDDAAGRALTAVIAILTFLAALSAVVAAIVARSSDEWRSSVSREATIQVRPSPGRDVEADLAAAATAARAVAGVASARIHPRAEDEALLEPWLGRGLDLGDLPVPRIVALRLTDGARPDLTALGAQLAAAVPGASVDDHGRWAARLSVMADTIVVVASGFVALVLAAAGLAVAFATRGAMAGAQAIVEVLHYVGADVPFIARTFGRGFMRLGLRGGAMGAGAAALLVTVAGFLAPGPTYASGQQVEALFGSFAIGPQGYAAIVAVAAAVAAIAGTVSSATVRRVLRRR